MSNSQDKGKAAQRPENEEEVGAAGAEDTGKGKQSPTSAQKQ